MADAEVAARARAAQEAEEERRTRERAAQAAAAAAAAEAERQEILKLNQTPRAVMAFRRPATVEVWKDTAAIETASKRALRVEAPSMYSQAHALRPQGRNYGGRDLQGQRTSGPADGAYNK